MEENLRDKTIHGIFWSFFQKISSQAISFAITVILARILTPNDYGIVALAGMLLILMGIFSDGGLGPALIQKKDADEKDYNTMFVTQLIFACILYGIVFFIAPWFSMLFSTDNEQLLTDIIRVMALTMPLGALAGVQNSVVTRRMMFKWYFYSNIISLAVSASTGIYMAYNGYGAWALVGQQILGIITSTLVIFFLLDWHPKFQFSYHRFKPLFSTGLKYMGTNFISTLTAQVKGYALGMKYSSSDLAYYNRGEGLPNLVCNNIDNTIQTVLFPALVNIQDDAEAMKQALRKAIQTSTYIMFPMLFGLAAIADKIVVVLYTERWLSCIPFMQITCFCFAIGIMCNVNLQALKARGLIGLILKLEFIKKPILFAVIIGTMFISPIAIAWGILLFNILVYFINSYPNKKNIAYSYKDQIFDILPNTLQALFMTAVVYIVGRIEMNIVVSLGIQIFTGISVYIVTSFMFKNKTLFYIIDYIKEKTEKK